MDGRQLSVWAGLVTGAVLRREKVAVAEWKKLGREGGGGA